MAKLTERILGAVDVLRGLKTASADVKAGRQSQRIGSDPSIGDEDILSAAFSFYRHYTHLEPDRTSIYSDMDEMYQYVLTHASMEAYIEDATQPDLNTGLTVWPTADNSEVQGELQRLFENLGIENRIAGDIWGMAKYGDHFPLLRYETKKGVFDAIPIDPRIVERVENSNRVLLGFNIGDTGEDTGGKANAIPRFKPWDLVHWKIVGKRPIDQYGTPFFIQVRLIYKVLKLMEEQMTIYRMNMHPDRLVFKVFTGGSGPDERFRIVNKWRRSMEKVASFNHDTGRFTSEYAPWMMNQNLYWAVGKEDNISGVEKFDGSANSGDIFDVEYMRDLFFAGTRVPKGYLGFEDSQGYRGTDTLSAQSIKFARGVRRLQTHYLQGLTRMCKIHLALRGHNPDDPKNKFTLHMTPVSYLDEAHRAELYAKRYEAMNYMIEIGDKMKESFGEESFNEKSWMIYLMKEFGQFDDNMIARLMTPQDQSVDLTFTPAGSAFRYENSGNSEKIREKILENDDLRKVVTEVLPTVDVDFRTTMSSTRDPMSVQDLKNISEANFDSHSYDSALKAHEAKKISLPAEAKIRLENELRALAEHMQDKYKENE